MAATFVWEEANGVAQTITSSRGEVNWKNIDDSTTAYTASPITAGQISFGKWQYMKFSGTYNQILNGLWAHTAGVLGTGLTLWGAPTGASQLTYATPSKTLKETGTVLTVNMSTVITIGSGTPVYFGATSANTAGKTASTTANAAYTNYLTTQLETTVSAAPGDTVTVTLTLQYDEN